MAGGTLVCVTDEPGGIQEAIQQAIEAFAKPDPDLGWAGWPELAEEAEELSGFIVDEVGL